jgi:NAD(P)-dependent dehydrogenase (short-subunit alcohol dehydrogenase family)
MESGNRPITVITGGSRGIGAATAIRLARAGHHLAVAYRDDRAAAKRLAAAITAQGVRCVTVRTDVAHEEDVDQLFTIATQRLGTVTGLVNNAGLTAHIGDLIDTPVDVIRRVIEVNFVGVVLCARRAAQLMSVRRAGGGGAIVNVSSAAATLGSAHEYVHYAAAKAAVDAFTVGLAKELAGDKIRVNAVAPGIVRTRIHADAGDPGRADRLASRIPVGRAGDPDEIAAAIAWLLSSEASYVTGAVLRAGGGL